MIGSGPLMKMKHFAEELTIHGGHVRESMPRADQRDVFGSGEVKRSAKRWVLVLAAETWSVNRGEVVRKPLQYAE